MNGNNNNQFFNTPQTQNNFFPQNNNMPPQGANMPNNMMNPQQGQMGNQQMFINQQMNQPVGQMPQQPIGQMNQPTMNAPMQPTQQPIGQVQPAQPVQPTPAPIKKPEPMNDSFVMATVPKDSLKNKNIAAAAVPSQTSDNVAKLDPLNNAKNPIPINPVAPKEEAKIEIKIPSPFDVIKAIFDTIKNPGKLLTDTVPKFASVTSATMYAGYLTAFATILMLIMRLIVGGFVKNYDIASGSYTTSYNFANVGNQNFLQYILIAIAISGVASFVIGLIYYATSFVKSKGMTLGKSLMISNVSTLPLILGIIVGFPLGGILSGYIAIILLGGGIGYTLILLITGMNMYMETDSLSVKIFYNLINFALVIAFVLLIIYLFFPRTPIGLLISVGGVG